MILREEPLPLPRLAPRMQAVRPSPTASVSDTARRLQAEGRDIINLGEGELSFDTPHNVRVAAIRAIERGDTKYTAVSGTTELKSAIRQKFQNENGLVFNDDQVIAGTGAKQIIFNAFLATLRPGDEVIIPAPYWVSYPDMVRLSGGEAVIVATGPETGFKLGAEALAGAITPRTRWLVLNSPGNPSGAVYRRHELVALAEVVRAHSGILVLSDDIYERIVFDGTFVTFGEAAPDLRERTLTVNGVSKSFSMTGWRLGYAGGPSWLIKALDVLQSQSTSNPCSISQAAAIEALTGPQDFLDDWLAMLCDNRDTVLHAIEETDGVLAAMKPAGAFYVFADCSGAIGRSYGHTGRIDDDSAMAGYLLSRAGVAVVPGIAFGRSPHVRIAYGVPGETLRKACREIVRACRALRPA